MRPSQEGYTGANWSIQVAKRALNIGLADDLVGDFNGVKAVNREEACLYAFNTLKATMVEYDKNSTVIVGNITIKEQSDAKEMANTGKTDGNIDKDGKMQFAEKYFEDLKKFGATDDFSRPATQWKIKAEPARHSTPTFSRTPPTPRLSRPAISTRIWLSAPPLIRRMSPSHINGEEAQDAAVVLKEEQLTPQIGEDYREKSGKKYSTAQKRRSDRGLL